jgi:hypothetical protein
MLFLGTVRPENVRQNGLLRAEVEHAPIIVNGTVPSKRANRRRDFAVEVDAEQVADKSSLADRKACGRRRLTNGTSFLPTADGRSVWARIARDTYAALIVHCGGNDLISEPQRLIAGAFPPWKPSSVSSRTFRRGSSCQRRAGDLASRPLWPSCRIGNVDCRILWDGSAHRSRCLLSRNISPAFRLRRPTRVERYSIRIRRKVPER